MLLRRISILAVLALSLGSTVALADANKQFNRKETQVQSSQGSGAHNKAQLMQELGLSSQQVDQIRVIRKKYRGQIAQQRQDLKQAQADLENMIAGTASTDEIRQKHNQIQSLRQQLEEVQFNSLLETREVMTPEQRIKYVQLMQSRRTKSLKPPVNRKDSQS